MSLVVVPRTRAAETTVHTGAATRTADTPVDEARNAIDDVGDVSRVHPTVVVTK